MSRGNKEHYGNADLKELLSDLGWGSSSFDNRFKRFCEVYGFEDQDYNMFKKDPEDQLSEYEFSWEWYPLFRAILKSLPEHPFFRENRQINNINVEDIGSYYTSLFNEIEKMPNHLKYEIMSHPLYQNALKESYAANHLSNKIAESIAAIELITKQERADIMIQIYQQLDEWTYNAFKHNYSLDLARSGYHDNNQELLTRMIGDDNCKNPDFKEENEALRAQWLQEEEYKRVEARQSQIDSLLVHILRRYLTNDKMPQPEGKLSAEEKRSRLKLQIKKKEEKQNILELVESLSLQNQESKKRNKKTIEEIKNFRFAYEQFLEKTSLLNETQMGQIDLMKLKIESCSYIERTARATIQSVQNEVNNFSEEQIEAAKRGYIERRKAYLEDVINNCEEELANLESGNTSIKDAASFEQEIQNEYLKFCDEVGIYAHQYKEASSSFIGQLIMAPSFKLRKDK
ncbi:hypothetical protein [Paenibacillus sp. sgz5001063]|uniref:hypothetical protein n=1 Tax=Paenibacillus sp. sgz5001063 TaxID=3242474 RepID=UPI0036D398A9